MTRNRGKVVRAMTSGHKSIPDMKTGHTRIQEMTDRAPPRQNTYDKTGQKSIQDTRDKQSSPPNGTRDNET